MKRYSGLIAIVIIAFIAFISCKKESNRIEPSETKAQVHFVDYVNGEPLRGLSVQAGYGSNRVFVVSDQLETDKDGNCSFVYNEHSVQVRPISDLYYDLAENDYYSLKKIDSFKYFSLEKEVGNERFYLAKLFRRSSRLVHIKQLPANSIGPNYAHYFNAALGLRVSGYDFRDTIENDHVVQSSELKFKLHSGTLLDTMIVLNIYGDIYNRMEWSVKGKDPLDDRDTLVVINFGASTAKILSTVDDMKIIEVTF